MKRDIDLIVKILRELEETKGATATVVVEIDGYDDELVQYNVGLMHDAGLVKAKRSLNPLAYHISEVTWEGHDFLDSARNELVVNKAKEFAKKKGIELFNLPLEVVKTVLVDCAKKYLLGE
ncbi:MULTISPECIES: DUF2513 domain-containing protein [Paenibacillus]|uniref:DUF2513 domain-containing protein n=1 Tax=Paenibacillus TaxID=44249 RepID=UPI0007ABFC93|nr:MULTISPECIES: DUF2513 domain-containing protein [Paenibacillus]KZE67911.1 hypothetical protein AV545_22715 [Paenibacillus jamilae]